MSLEMLKAGVMSLVFTVLVVAALTLGLNSFRNDIEKCNQGAGTTSWSFNSSSGMCYNSSNRTYAETTGYSYQYNITNKGLDASLNASNYFGTIGTMLGVAALVAVVVGAFYLVKS